MKLQEAMSTSDEEVPLDDVTAEMIVAANRELLALVDDRLPERFYRSEGFGRPALCALVARMAGILDSITLLVGSGRQQDTLVLLRTLYEHMLLFCWIAIDPEHRTLQWRDHAVVQRRKLHNDVRDFGVELMSAEELAEAAELEALPGGLQQRAEEVDAFWSQRIRGFRPPLKGDKEGLLTVRGLYTAIYRLASRVSHAQIETIGDCIDMTGYPARPAVVHAERDETMTWSAIGTPVFAMALMVCHHRLGWPDDARVRDINDAMTRRVEPLVAGDSDSGTAIT